MSVHPNCTASWVQRTVTGQDDRGNDVFADGTVTVDAVFAPGGSTEQVQGGDLVVTQPTLYLMVPPGVVDQMTVNGVTYDVDGTPQAWPVSPFSTWQPQYPIVVRLKNVTG